jgi:hypothetical protein
MREGAVAADLEEVVAAILAVAGVAEKAEETLVAGVAVRCLDTMGAGSTMAAVIMAIIVTTTIIIMTTTITPRIITTSTDGEADGAPDGGMALRTMPWPAWRWAR